MPTFSELPLSPALARALSDLGFTEATPIQAEALPALLAGRDLRGKARTGSGKTLAYVLPLLQALTSAPTVQALVLVPTRELATQVAEQVRKVGRRLPGLRVLVLAGGQPIGPQLGALVGGVHVIVGTPGRVLDHLGRGTLPLDGVRVAVLDEADRMLELGFADDVERIRAALPAGRQTALFSATFPPELEERWLRDPVRVDLPDPAEVRAWAVRTADREASVRQVLRALQPESTLLFRERKAEADLLARALAAEGFAARAIHGDLDQHERDDVLACFRTGSVRVLVATDVAARGLDVVGLDLVLEVDPAPNAESHLHRIGRTGRAGRPGTAITLVSERQAERVAGWVAVGPAPEGEGPALGSERRTIAFGAGRKDKLRPGDVLGALTGVGGLRADQVGRIVVAERRAWAGVDAGAAEEVARRLARGEVKGRRMWVGVI